MLRYAPRLRFPSDCWPVLEVERCCNDVYLERAEMTWTKTGDEFADECYGLSDRAYRLHHEGLTVSNKFLLDCILEPKQVKKFIAYSQDALDELLEKGFWARVGNSYEIIHQARYQRKKEDVLRQQRANKANGAKGGRPKHADSLSWAEKSRLGGRKTESVNNPDGLKTHSVKKAKSESVSESLSESVYKTHSLTERDGSGYKEEIEDHDFSQNSELGYISSEWNVPTHLQSQSAGEFCGTCAAEGRPDVPVAPGEGWCSEHLQVRLSALG